MTTANTLASLLAAFAAGAVYTNDLDDDPTYQYEHVGTFTANAQDGVIEVRGGGQGDFAFAADAEQDVGEDAELKITLIVRDGNAADTLNLTLLGEGWNDAGNATATLDTTKTDEPQTITVPLGDFVGPSDVFAGLKIKHYADPDLIVDVDKIEVVD